MNCFKLQLTVSFNISAKIAEENPEPHFQTPHGVLTVESGDGSPPVGWGEGHVECWAGRGLPL